MWRRAIRVGLACASVVAVAIGLERAVAAWRFDTCLFQARRDMQAGRYAQAREQLAWLAKRWPGQDDVSYALGTCEQQLGHSEAALAALARVSAGAPVGDLAGLRRAQILLRDRGQFAGGEEILVPISRGSGPAAQEARALLIELWGYEGRVKEIRRLLQAGWRPTPEGARRLRALWLLDTEPPPIDKLNSALEQAARKAPEDDRIWLGQANLATISGNVAKAGPLLEACLARRGTDPAVWLARLEWSLAARRPDELAGSLRHLSREWFEPGEVYTLQAWIAKQRNNPRREYSALKHAIDAKPGDAPALERLAALSVDLRDIEGAAAYRRRKGEVDRARERTRALLAQGIPDGKEAELGRLAETLGRTFEARGWWSLAVQRDPGQTAARQALQRLDHRAEESARRVSEALADLLKDCRAEPGSSRIASMSIQAGPAPDFRDDAKAVGLHFRYDNGRTSAHQLPETMGGGVALLDYDGDGWIDVYCVQGGPFPPDPAHMPGDRLFHNRGDGTFEDASETSGIAGMPRGYGHGVTVGDYDNDGHPDLFLTRWRSYALYRNRGDGTFEDATQKAGLGGDRDWPTSAAFADLDNDGDLDLYVCHYLKWDAESPTLCRRFANSDIYLHCDPRNFEALPDHLFRNDGGHFVDVTEAAGLHDSDGRGLGVVASDLDGDGLVDLFIANDTTANYLLRNRGGMQFEEAGLMAGVSASAGGGYQAGMGVACGDLNDDGLPDLLVTNFYGESTTFFQNLGHGFFADRTAAIGLTESTRFKLGFGIALFDLNNDSRLDLAIANGHVNDYSPHVPYAMPAQLLAGAASGVLDDVSNVAGTAWRIPRVGRGLAVGDLDNDGRVDVLIIAQQGPLVYLHNQGTAGRSIAFWLRGTASNRDGTGARIVVYSGGQRAVAWRSGGGSYLSASDPRLHFGLGHRGRVNQVEVTWPSGRTDSYRDLTADRGYEIREGDPQLKELPHRSKAMRSN